MSFGRTPTRSIFVHPPTCRGPGVELDVGSLRRFDIMPSGLTVHRVLIAPRDSILQNVETVIQCSTWPLHHWRSPRGIQTHRFFISREISCIEQLRLYSAEDGDVMFQWTVVLDLELEVGRRDCCRGCSYRIT
ncbi:hypothetical protein TNCV_1469801 [Trichonephila clavipes]|nr:hypothetical protein TNCV_1469801 [Trichonephila clavipes]